MRSLLTIFLCVQLLTSGLVTASAWLLVCALMLATDDVYFRFVTVLVLLHVTYIWLFASVAVARWAERRTLGH